MAKAKFEVIEALRKTVKNLQEGSQYMWGHMGSCNCGNLAQVITKYTKAEIHAFAMNGSGDWNDQLNDYCETSQLPMDLLIFELLTFGFSTEDLQNLEKLSDTSILSRLPEGKRFLNKNVKQDVILYMTEWANMLEEQLLETIKLPNFELEPIQELA